MDSKTFKTEDGIDLIVKSRKHAVIFEIPNHKHHQATLDFSPLVFDDFVSHLETVSKKAWANISPKEADSLGSDYYEYYDKEFDNNGYLTLRNNWIFVERPSLESSRFYKFNKKKMESLLYDLKK